MDVVCVDTLITGSAEYQIIDHLGKSSRREDTLTKDTNLHKNIDNLCIILYYIGLSRFITCHPVIVVLNIMKFTPAVMQLLC